MDFPSDRAIFTLFRKRSEIESKSKIIKTHKLQTDPQRTHKVIFNGFIFIKSRIEGQWIFCKSGIIAIIIAVKRSK
jgi:hypothetical protein